MISVTSYPPSAPLSPLVACYTCGVFNTTAQVGATIEVVPNGCPEVIIHLQGNHCQLPGRNGMAVTPDYMLIGLFRRTFRVRFNTPVPVFSIRFKPEALSALFQVEGQELLNGFEDGDLLFGKSFRTVCDRIREARSVVERIAYAERYLLSRLARRVSPRDYVARSAALMRACAGCSVEDISRRVCISQRQLERKFRREIGISPKQYLNLMRINRVVRALEQDPSLDLTSIAYDCGYFDQAHFIKDFKRTTGLLPSEYRKGERNMIALSS